MRCQSKSCIENNVSGRLSFLPGHSKFVSYQEMKIQETPDQLGQGKIPKNFTVQVRGSLVKQANPGDSVIVQGILVTKRKTGKFDNDLAFATNILALDFTREKKKYLEMNISE